MNAFLKSGKGKAVIISSAILIIAVIVMFPLMVGGETGYRNISVFKIFGSVTAENNGNTYEAYENMRLADGYALNTDTDSYTRLSLDDDKYVKLEQESRAEFRNVGDAKNHITSIYLANGSLVSEIVNPLSETESFIVNTPNAIIAVRGTLFRVDVSFDEAGDAYTDVYTYGGAVACCRVMPDGTVVDEEVIVHQGYKARIKMDEIITVYIEELIEDGPEDSVDPINVGEISDSDIVDTYNASYHGHTMFLSTKELWQEIIDRNINIEEYYSPYDMGKIEPYIETAENTTSAELTTEETTAEDTTADTEDSAQTVATETEAVSTDAEITTATSASGGYGSTTVPPGETTADYRESAAAVTSGVYESAETSADITTGTANTSPAYSSAATSQTVSAVTSQAVPAVTSWTVPAVTSWTAPAVTSWTTVVTDVPEITSASGTTATVPDITSEPEVTTGTTTSQTEPTETTTSQTEPDETTTSQTEPDETTTFQTEPDETSTSQTEPEATPDPELPTEVLYIGGGSVTITETGYTQGEDGEETVYTGNYVIRQQDTEMAGFSLNVESGSHSITLEDINLSGVQNIINVSPSASVILTGNGYDNSITVNLPFNYAINNQGDLTFADIKLAADGIRNSGTLTAEDGSDITINHALLNENGGIIHISNGCSLNIVDTNALAAINNGSDCSIVISGGRVYSSGRQYGILNYGSVTVSGGSVSLEAANPGEGNYDISTDEPITVTGGSLRLVNELLGGSMINEYGDELECVVYDGYPGEITLVSADGTSYVYTISDQDAAEDGKYYLWLPVQDEPDDVAVNEYINYGDVPDRISDATDIGAAPGVAVEYTAAATIPDPVSIKIIPPISDTLLYGPIPLKSGLYPSRSVLLISEGVRLAVTLRLT